jgi:hypothetical protein
MKTLATIALSLIAIVASLALILSTTCALNGDFMGHKDPLYFLWAAVSLVVVIACMRTIRTLKRKS